MENQLDAFMEGEDDWSERSPESWQRPIPEERRSPPGRDQCRPQLRFNDRIETDPSGRSPPSYHAPSRPSAAPFA